MGDVLRRGVVCACVTPRVCAPAFVCAHVRACVCCMALRVR